MKNKIPDRWENYVPVGRRVSGTRFLPFKVPLKPELLRNQAEDERFTPSILLENTPMLKAVIDLTNTNRYYKSEEFTDKGLFYKKIYIQGGGCVPSRKICNEFFEAVDELCRMLRHDSDALIGVHCTHGLNRTGYLICKYMVLRMKIDPQEAINKFQVARGYEIERKNYVSDILSESRNWRTENQRSLTSYSRYGEESRSNAFSSHSRRLSESTNWRTENQRSLTSYSRYSEESRSNTFSSHWRCYKDRARHYKRSRTNRK